MEKQLVIFELGGESYGVDIAAVESIIKMQGVTRIPKAPRFIEGITSLRGQVMPVIDLRKRFQIQGEADHAAQRIMVVAIDNLKVGLIVDVVSEVLTITDQAIEPPPAMVLSVDTTFIIGIAQIDSRLVILLDLHKVLSVEEQKQLVEYDVSLASK